jgi:hypothetical protein
MLFKFFTMFLSLYSPFHVCIFFFFSFLGVPLYSWVFGSSSSISGFVEVVSQLSFLV